MMLPFALKPEERRPAWLAFFALLGITAAHTLIETARDALFLARVPVNHLPVLYIAIAGLGLATTRIGEWTNERFRASREGGFALSLAASGAITLVFWAAATSPTRPLLYALYLYSGLFASWVAGRLWIQLGTIFTVVQAKRAYGLIGTGGVLGAVLGAALARASLTAISVRHLLAVGAVLLVLTAAFPAAMLPKGSSERARPRLPQVRSRSSVVAVAKHPYLGSVLGLVLVTACIGTAIDFVFKAEVIANVPKEELGSFLATVSLASNVASLLVQAIGVGLAMRHLGVHRALYVLPLLVGGGACAAALGVGFAAAIAMRTIDGAFRHSLQKTATELLFVPLADDVRARAKPIVDLVGQRGGQAIASVAILGLASIGGPRAVGACVLALAVAALFLARTVRPRYLEVFRDTLRRGRIEVPAGMPELDVNALEALIGALSSRKDAAVVGALDLLAAQNRGRLVPSLVLYHPSKTVVLRALDIFVRERRTDFVPVADRLLEHGDPEIRAAALRARAAVEHDPRFLESLLGDSADEIRATALVALVARSDLSGEDARRALDELAEKGPASRGALARAIGEIQQDPRERTRPLFESALLRLAAAEEGETRALACAAMGRLRGNVFFPALLRGLDDRRSSATAIDAFAAMGDEALVFLEETLDRDDVAPEVKWRIVRAIARSTSPDNVDRLAPRVLTERDGATKLRLLRALRAAQMEGTALPLKRRDLVRLAAEAVTAIGSALGFRLAHRGLLESDPSRRRPGADLLQTLLRDQEQEAQRRLFLVLGLLYPHERFVRIQRGLGGANAKTRASSRELLENVLEPELRETVLAAVDEEDGEESRLSRIGEVRREDSYRELLLAMVEQGGELGAVAAFHANELGLRESMREAATRAEAEGGAFANLGSSEA